uniref:Fibronectin type-III domain-containing protein n=1 Tax=Meloidogyne incognita TaxID=6306 RepID=A0A914LGD3_MELIC
MCAIRNLRSHYDAATDTILVDWEWDELSGELGRQLLEDYEIFVRYKVSRQGQNEDEWRRVEAEEDGHGARIPLGRLSLSDGDEVMTQVLAEPLTPPETGSSASLKQHSEPLVVWIGRRQSNSDGNSDGYSENNFDGNSGGTNSDFSSNSETNSENNSDQNSDFPSNSDFELPKNPPPIAEEILPPYNFTANILGPTQVKLEWKTPPRSSDTTEPYYFYIINVRQISANDRSGRKFAPLQIRVDKTNFLLGHLVPGERYEITLRSATSSDRISSAAAIVEIALPKEDEGALMDVGNLLVTSRFMHDGRGVVNLTWEVPPQLIGKIKSYEMRYIEASNAQSGIERWEHLHFPGEAPHAQLYSMKPDTEYLIRIRTLLISGLQVESGEFRIHTPRIKEPNPLARLDVLYSSEQPTVRLQWTLAPHIHSSEITGYDLRITDRYDLPESEWRHHRVSGYSPQFALDNLRPYTTYFVHVDIRKNNGDVLKGNTIYRFTTLANLPVIPNENFVDKGNEVQPLAFEQIDRGRVKIIWEFPSTVVNAAKGYLKLI